MSLFRAAAVSALALVAVLQTTGEAAADHRYRMRVLWPKIYAPHLSGYLYRDETDDEDVGFFDPEDEEDVFIPRRHRDRNVVLDYGNEDEDLDPVYEPPVKRVVKPKTKKVAVKKTPAKPVQTASAVVKPKVKPVIKPAAPVATKVSASSSEAVTIKSPTSTAAIKANPPLTSAAVVAKPPIPAANTVTPPPAKVATAATAAKAAAPAGAGIGCSKGAEIVSGYGFTSVKPRTCSGATYTFDATRAANAYLIKVSSATGEISDVQKLK